MLPFSPDQQEQERPYNKHIFFLRNSVCRQIQQAVQYLLKQVFDLILCFHKLNRVKKSGKRYIMRKEYEKERDAYKGDIYSFSFVNRTEYVNRILECGPNVKNADCPLWANMAGNLLDQISFWVYKK